MGIFTKEAPPAPVDNHYYDPVDDLADRSDDPTDYIDSSPLGIDDFVGDDEVRNNEPKPNVFVRVINRFVKTKPMPAPRAINGQCQAGVNGQRIVEIVPAQPARRRITLQNCNVIASNDALIAFKREHLSTSTGYLLTNTTNVTLEYNGPIYGMAWDGSADGSRPVDFRYIALFDDG